MRSMIAFTTALLLSAAPASAQILGGGGGGLGGMLGGSLNGSIGGTLGGAGGVGGTLDSVRSGTSGTLRGAGSSTGSQSVDRKAGRVKADRSASANGSGDATQSLTGPASALTGNASASGNASAGGSLDAQLLGTDAVRGTAEGVKSSASQAQGNATQETRDAAVQGQGQSQGLIGAPSSLTGTLTGSGNAAGSSTAGGASGPLTGSASGSGSGNGALTVAKGMPVLSPDGERIGRVRQVITNARGEAEQLLVKVDGQLATLPAANFSASGNAVMSAMAESQIKQVASEQQTASQ